MPLTFNMLLRDEGIDPKRVRLLRHQTSKYKGRTPYGLWRESPDDPVRLERYQSTQSKSDRGNFASDYWASFVVTPDSRTVFVGMYSVHELSVVPPAWHHDLNDDIIDPAANDLYDVRRHPALSAYRGRLEIEWGGGYVRWTQRAGNQDKRITALTRTMVDPVFPGYSAFVSSLSALESLPPAWNTALASVAGIYLLTCPETGMQYVGSASGAGGLLQRWQAYRDGRDGGNVGLTGRNTDFLVSILQVMGAADGSVTDASIEKQEAVWVKKLQSRTFGLNRNG